MWNHRVISKFPGVAKHRLSPVGCQERTALPSIAITKISLEVQTPNLMGIVRLAQRIRVRWRPAQCLTPLNQAFTFRQVADNARRRPRFLRPHSHRALQDLVRTPSGIRPGLCDDQRLLADGLWPWYGARLPLFQCVALLRGHIQSEAPFETLCTYLPGRYPRAVAPLRSRPGRDAGPSMDEFVGRSQRQPDMRGLRWRQSSAGGLRPSRGTAA